MPVSQTTQDIEERGEGCSCRSRSLVITIGRPAQGEKTLIWAPLVLTVGDVVQVQVRLFASLREEVGHETVALELENPATVADLLRAFVDTYPHALSVGQAIVAVNQEVANREARVEASDEIAFLPPVSGGIR